jgi:hypothetical protein
MEDARAAVSSDEQAACEALRSLYAFSVEEPELCAPGLLADTVSLIVNEGFCNSRVRGTLLAIHQKQGRIDMAEFALRINARLESSMNDAEEAAAFIAGVFLVGRDALFADKNILEQIDKLVGGIDDEVFSGVLPNLRLAFTSFLPSETDRIAQTIADIYKLSPQDISRPQRVTREELEMGMALDKKAAEAMAKWF